MPGLSGVGAQNATMMVTAILSRTLKYHKRDRHLHMMTVHVLSYLLCSMLCQACQQLAHCESHDDGHSNLQQQAAGQALVSQVREDLHVRGERRCSPGFAAPVGAACQPACMAVAVTSRTGAIADTASESERWRTGVNIATYRGARDGDRHPAVNAVARSHRHRFL